MAKVIKINGEEPPELLTPGEVARLFRVDAKTVVRWSKAGKLPAAVRTLGGHRRYSAAVIADLMKPPTS